MPDGDLLGATPHLKTPTTNKKRGYKNDLGLPIGQKVLVCPQRDGVKWYEGEVVVDQGRTNGKSIIVFTDTELPKQPGMDSHLFFLTEIEKMTVAEILRTIRPK